ncbi:MAG: acetyl-CoA acyltransferase [Myxococcota bacterium]|jgi:acetyl-CoA acyltransferase
MSDVVIVSAARTAIGKAKRGSFKDTRPDTLIGLTVKEVVRRSGVNPDDIDDLIVGTATPEAEQGMNIARIAGMYAGLPDSVPGLTINRFCSSGLQSIAQGAASIMAGWQKVVVAGGVESMTQIAMGGQKPSPNPELMAERPAAYTPMGITAENVASRLNVSREDQDAFALESNLRAARAIADGTFKDEIFAVETRVFKDGAWHAITMDTDEGPRASSTMEGLGKLRPVFKAGGSVTAGNSSQMSDGAAAVVIADADYAKEHNLPVLGLLKSYQVVGVDPEIMGVGPRYAIPKAVEAAGLKIEDIGLFEINEAFASQAVYCARELGLDMAKVNPNGGAIALGHPLGCTGAKLTATLLYEMKRQNVKYGVVSMCIGGGMGAAAVFENPDA